MKEQGRYQILLSILILYAFLSFMWWGYLMLDKSGQIYYLKSLIIDHNYLTNETKDSIRSEKKLQTWMILGEGIVFVSILAVGSYYLFKSLRKQLQLNQQQNNFLLSITHELKTPIASLQLALETIKQRELSIKTRDKLLQNSITDIQRLNDLVENILLSSKLMGKKEMESFQRKELVSLADFFQKETQILQKAYPTRNIQVSRNEKQEVSINTFGIHTLVFNLLDNALKHTTEDIWLQYQVGPKKLRIEVKDQGIGIPDADKKKLFQKFQRLEEENTRKTTGTGLGLYLCKQIIDILRGRIWIKDNHPNGSIFVVEIPI